jgi:hypothetical protein
MFNTLWKLLFPAYTGKQYTTIKYAFPVVVLATLFASLASVISENSSYITIATSETSVTRDQEFFVNVSVTAHVAVNAVDLVLTYPQDTIEVLGIDTGTSVITLWTEQPYFKDGKIYLRGGTFRKGFIGEHTLARVKVRAIEAGNARIFVSKSALVAGDGKGTEIPVEEGDGKNEVKIAVMGEDGVLQGEATISLITDTDGDGKVDLKDVSTFMAAWFTKAKTYDFDGDGRMTFKDFSILLADSFTR